MCLSYDPLAGEFSNVLTLGDLLEANLKFHGKEAGFNRINELFVELDRDGNAALDEEEFYRFCDAVVVQTETDREMDVEEDDLDLSIRSNSSSHSITDSGRPKGKNLSRRLRR